MVGPRYFDTIGVRIIRGRATQRQRRPARAGERGRQPAVRQPCTLPAKIRSAAALGFTPDSRETARGLVDDRRHRAERPPAEHGRVPNRIRSLYLSYRFEPPLGIGVLVRSRSTAAAVAPLLRAELRAIDPDLPLFQIQTMDENMARQRWQYTVFGSMFAFFAFIAL